MDRRGRVWSVQNTAARLQGPLGNPLQTFESGTVLVLGRPTRDRIRCWWFLHQCLSPSHILCFMRQPP